MTNDSLPNSLPALENTSSPAAEPVPAPTPEAVPPPVIDPEPDPVHAPIQEPEPAPAPVKEPEPEEPEESFADLLNAFERSHTHRAEPGSKQLQGTVVSLSADQVFLDIGYKAEGVLPRSSFDHNAEGVKIGDVFPVSVTGRNEEHYYVLSRFKVALPRDWSALEAAFAEKTAVVGTVTGVIKGGLTVDVGVRAFMPASRSGTKDAVELEKLVGTEITCRITKLDVTDEDVVVDRRIVLEEQARGLQAKQFEAMKEGAQVSGTVRSLMPYGAFVDLGGIDGLLHVSDIAYTRIEKPEDVLTVGQELELRILKIDHENKKISLGLKQLLPEPWETVPERFKAGQRVTGTVTRLADFGAFVEIEPGIEGLIHISEMSWGKKIRHPSDVLKQGEQVDAVILGIKFEERRISLGLKQTLSDPWTEVQLKFPAGSQIEGPVTKLMNFGAFVQVADGIEGLVHVSEISADKRINHPSDELRVGQIVKAQVLAVDTEKRQMKLSMKQLVPTDIDEYIAEHKVGDEVTGRIVDASGSQVLVELGEGIRALCATAAKVPAAKAAPEAKLAKVDLSSLSSMLKARWKGDAPDPKAAPEALAEGQIRSFKIVKIDADAKRIEVELA